MEQIDKSETDLKNMFDNCQNFSERVGILGIMSQRRLDGFLAAAECATRIEMQYASTMAMVSVNLQGDGN